MSKSMEDLLSETLRGYAADSRDVPGMSARATQRGQQVRHRRRVAVAVLSVVAIVGAAGFFLPRSGGNHAAPPAHASSTAEASSTPTATKPAGDWLSELRIGDPLDQDYVSGSRASFAELAVDLPDSWVVSQLERFAGGWVVAAQTSSVGDATVLATVSREGVIEILVESISVGVAVDASGSRLAYGQTTDDGRGGVLSVVEAATGKVIASHRIRQPAAVHDWAGDSVLFSYAVDPGGPPMRWNTRTDRVSAVATSKQNRIGPLYLAHESNGDEIALEDPTEGCLVLIRATRKAYSRRCGMPSIATAAYAPDEGGLALATFDSEVVVVNDVGHEVWRTNLPSGLTVDQVVWQAAQTLLLVVRDDAGEFAPRALRCEVSGSCEQAPGPDLEATTLVLRGP